MDWKKLSYKMWALIAILVLVGSIGAIYVYGTYFAKIPTGGTIETTIPLLLTDPSIIDWGTITVYGSTTKTVTLTNNSTENEIVYDMIFETANWQNTTDLGLTLTWNYTGTNIYPTESLPVQFALTSTTPPQLEENATETIIHFSFDIHITPIT